MDFIEVTAKTVDEAITKACLELEVSSDRLEIEVVREGSSGFFGLGSKPAIIKVRKKEEEVKAEEPVAPVKKAKPEPKKAYVKKEAVKREKISQQEEKPVKKEENVRENLEETVKVVKTDAEIAQMKKIAREFLENVFGAMGLEVVITIEYDAQNNNLDIDFSGDDMGILIGKRGQTLDSLQYLTSLVVNKEQEEYVRIKLDTENYRKRRKDTLENLARNIAYKVKKTRRSVSLEPMNPYERRIIHSALQGNKFVETYSEGNEPYRHVVVTLKNNK